MTRRWTTFFAAAVLVAVTTGVGTAQQESIEELRARAEQGDLYAQHELGVKYANVEEDFHDDNEAARWFRLAAEKGFAWSQYELGGMYATGRGVLKDDVAAVHWFRLAAEQGLSIAESNLGFMYEEGRGVEQNYSEAFFWYGKAAEQGYASAQFSLARMYEVGRSVQQSDALAAHWYRLAADQGDEYAQFRLGLAFSDGRGVSQDDTEAIHWYGAAAGRGHPQAQYVLGLMHVFGRGVEQDFDQAIVWYLRAARQGVVDAQFNLARMYSAGRRIEQNDVEAFVWYRSAAEQGHPESQYELGLRYYAGRGVGENHIYALAWLELAARQPGNHRSDAVAARDDVARGVTLIDRQEAERIAEELRRAGAIKAPEGRLTQRSAPPESPAGTAFVVDPSGLLLTAHHVVERATSISVSCNGGPAVPATIRSSSPTVDMALLQVEDSLGTEAFLTLASDNEASLGDRVFTIGYPSTGLLGLDPKYTEGTVSALSGYEGDASFLQISVPIQPGNSGGALVNERGEVVGVVVSSANVVRFVQESGQLPQNINWAIKSNFARGLFPALSAEVVSVNDAEDVIERAKKATCLVMTSAPSREYAETVSRRTPETVGGGDPIPPTPSSERTLPIKHRHAFAFRPALLTLKSDSLEFRHPNDDSHDFVIPASQITQLNTSTIVSLGGNYSYVLHFSRRTRAGSRITFEASLEALIYLSAWLQRAAPQAINLT